VIHAQGFFQIQAQCPDCEGTGKKRDPCRTCNGSSLVSDQREVSVKVPAGVSDGTKLRLSNQGDAGPLNGPKGDLWIRLKVEKDAVFERQGEDVTVEIDVSVLKAMVGGTVEVPTLAGTPVTLKVAPGTQPDQKVVMRGKGIKSLRNTSKGNQYVIFKVRVPKELSEEQTALLKQAFPQDALAEEAAVAAAAAAADTEKDAK
jgi:molecular chaperone DnaJ